MLMNRDDVAAQAYAHRRLARAYTLLDRPDDADRNYQHALDLYSGVGLFAAGLASRVGETGTVVAVEADGRAAADARRSLHDLPQVRFAPGKVADLVLLNANPLTERDTD